MNESLALLATRILPEIQARRDQGVILVVDGEQTAEALARLLTQLVPDGPAHHFPAWDCLPYDRAAPAADLMGQRMRVLCDIASHGPTMLVTTPEAVIQRVPPADILPKPLVLKTGSKLDMVALAEDLGCRGYVHADRVDDPGQVAIRGEVVDIFPASPRPYRITLDRHGITAIHRYDPATQRSTGEVSSIRIDAMSEAVTDTADRFEGIEHWWPDLYGTASTLFDMMPRAAVFLAPEAGSRLDRQFEAVSTAHRDRLAADKADPGVSRRPLQPNRLYLAQSEWVEATEGRRMDFRSTSEAGEAPRFCLMDKPGHAFAAFVAEAQAADRRVVLTGARERELAILAKQAEHATGTAPLRIAAWDGLPPRGAKDIALLRLSADHGFVDEARGIVLITAADLIGHHARSLSARAVPVPWHLGDGDFATGDRVIHLDHGVGTLQGLETVKSPDGGLYDAVRLSFAGGSDLLIPVDTLDRVWRYGGGNDEVALDKLGGTAWPKRQAKIAKDIDAAAESLVDSARRRRGLKAVKIVPPRRDYERFVSGFSFAPTADQMHAIDDCLRDLAAETPMDRLVVGDVGFGKTEVALRAAAAAVLSGRQVAVVAPTTVLARQHVDCFARRFADVGIEVAQLSRLTPPGDAERIKAGLADGRIRLVVGTQALCGADVTFRDLGLLVIDEEQRFGTGDKEQLRTLGKGIHVLTLTATPIPRTLQAALVGLQDLSVIATPPARRRPIRTLLAAFDMTTVRTALLKEKARGGQSFVVVPRIEDMDGLASTLRGLMPELTLRMAHGQMDLAEIDTAMSGFAAGDGDVLLATSIIESGLDVPRANTMVICRADRFGLAELHQLRGRVGRGQRQGVCYLMTAADAPMTPATERRLTTLARLDRLGSGMAISAQDLDARGSGDLVGDEQAGHSRLIGLGLYQHLLQRALRDAGSDLGEDWAPELHLGDGGAFAADYIPEPDVRINLYARVARATDVHDLDLLSEEVEDRFGPMPAAAAALLARARLRCLCRSRSVARIDAGPKAIAFTPRRGTSPEALLAHASRQERAIASIKKGRLLFSIDGDAEGTERVTLSTRLLQGIA